VIGPITWTGSRAIYTVDTPNSRIAIFIELPDVLVSLWNNNLDWSPKSQLEPSIQDIPSYDRAIYTELLKFVCVLDYKRDRSPKRDRQQSHL
jgi:hypothetical protein